MEKKEGEAEEEQEEKEDWGGGKNAKVIANSDLGKVTYVRCNRRRASDQ